MGKARYILTFALWLGLGSVAFAQQASGGATYALNWGSAPFNPPVATVVVPYNPATGKWDIAPAQWPERGKPLINVRVSPSTFKDYNLRVSDVSGFNNPLSSKLNNPTRGSSLRFVDKTLINQ